jgi:hypothetical protein
MNPFFKQVEYFDFNPGMIRQFREWLRGSGPYAGQNSPGVPDLSSYRRAQPLTLDEVNRVARRNWSSWDEVDPPRKFPGSLYRPMQPGESTSGTTTGTRNGRCSASTWWGSTTTNCRSGCTSRHTEGPHLLGAGIHFADPGNKPIAIKITSRGKNTDTSGVSLEGRSRATATWAR